MHAVEWLESLLVSQQEGLARLLELCQQERTHLLKGQLSSLDALTREQADLLAQHAQLCTRTYAVVERLAVQLDLPAQTSLDAVLPHLDRPVAARLQARAHALKTLAHMLQQQGRVNWHLAQQALRYVDFTLKVIGQAAEQPRPYASSSHATPASSVSLLVNHCA